jgi:hypothetical protein
MEEYAAQLLDPKQWYLSAIPHRITFQKTIISIVPAFRTSNVTVI